MDKTELGRYYLDDYVFSGLDIAALIILLLVVGMSCVQFVFLGGLPGRVARAKSHPDANAIRVGGWATLIMAGIGWPFVLMWAYRCTGKGILGNQEESDFDEVEKLRSRIAELEQNLSTQNDQVKDGALAEKREGESS